VTVNRSLQYMDFELLQAVQLEAKTINVCKKASIRYKGLLKLYETRKSGVVSLCSPTGAGVRAVNLADKMIPLISLFSVLRNRLAWVWCSPLRGAEQYPCVQLRH
jgi:hypothetical protein